MRSRRGLFLKIFGVFKNVKESSEWASLVGALSFLATPQTWYKYIQDLRSKYEIVHGRRGSLLRRRNTTKNEVNGDAQ